VLHILYLQSALSNRRCSSSFCKTFHSSHCFISFRPACACSDHVHVVMVHVGF